MSSELAWAHLKPAPQDWREQLSWVLPNQNLKSGIICNPGTLNWGRSHPPLCTLPPLPVLPSARQYRWDLGF